MLPQENSPLEFSNYLFVFAHPDDEIYTCAFLEKLVRENKKVQVLYVTSGDYTGAEIAQVREEEVFESMRILGVKKESVYFLRIPERQLMDRLQEVVKELNVKATLLKPDCIISHDFEGGHNGHDAVSFCTYRIAEDLNIPVYFFPAYNGWPENRQWNQFVPGRPATYTLPLSGKQREIQKSVIFAHKTQKAFFDLVLKSSSANIFSTREVLRQVTFPIDYTSPPAIPLGYEYPGSKINFEDFKKAVRGEAQKSI